MLVSELASLRESDQKQTPPFKQAVQNYSSEVIQTQVRTVFVSFGW